MIDGDTGGYTWMQYANDARGMKGWKNNMEAGRTGTFTAIRKVKQGEELLFAYDKGGRGGYWRQWGKKKGAKGEGARGALTTPRAPHTPTPGGRRWQREHGGDGGDEQRGDAHNSGIAQEGNGSDDSNAQRGKRDGEERDGKGGEGGGERKEEGRENSGGVWGERVREGMSTSAERGDGSRASGKGKRKRCDESGSSSGSRRAERNANVKHRASAAVVSELERRLQEARGEVMGVESGGSTWFERGEGGGVT